MVQRCYDNGLPFSSSYAKNLDALILRVKKRKASLLIIDGGIGEGKTTLLIHTLNYINYKSNHPNIDIEGPQLSMGGAEFTKNIRVCYEKKLPCIGYDEAGDFSKRGTMSNFNAMLNRTFETFRAFKCIVVLTLPDFAVLDNDLFRKGIPRLLINCRGRLDNYGTYAGFGLSRMMWLKEYYRKYPIRAYAFKKVIPNFRGQFLNLSKEHEAELDRISTTSKLDILRKAEVKLDGLLTIDDLAARLKRGPKWTSIALNKMKIKEKTMIGPKKFFDNEAYVKLLAYRNTTGR